MMQSIYEILEDGNFIVAGNEDYSLLLTVNYVYVQIWRYTGTGQDGEAFEAVEALHIPDGKKLHETTFENVTDYAKERADEFITDDLNHDVDEDDEPMEYGTIFPNE